MNTEWLYAIDSITQKIKNQREIVFEVGRNIVSYFHSRIKKDFPEYTIVTLMHRNPNDLSWSEVNHTNTLTKPTLGMLYHCSDMIISGHDHSVHTDILDLLRNQIQHFRLGSCCLSPSNEGESFPYSISILHVDPIQEMIQILRGSYVPPSEEGQSAWKFEEIPKNFILRNKYEKVGWKYKNKFYSPSLFVKIRVKHFYQETIFQEIKRYFLYDNLTDEDLLLKLHILELGVASLEEIKSALSDGETERHHFILYTKKYHSQENILDDALEEYGTVLDEMKQFLIQGRVIVNWVYLETADRAS